MKLGGAPQPLWFVRIVVGVTVVMMAMWIAALRLDSTAPASIELLEAMWRPLFLGTVTVAYIAFAVGFVSLVNGKARLNDCWKHGTPWWVKRIPGSSRFFSEYLADSAAGSRKTLERGWIWLASSISLMFVASIIGRFTLQGA